MQTRTIPVETGPRRLEALVATAGEEAVAGVRAAAEPLRGLRVVHLASPPFAPCALDTLRSTVPLLRDVGIDARWLAVSGDDRSGAAARAVGDALRGGEAGPPEDVAHWRQDVVDAAAEIPRATDVVVVHGAEGLAVLARAQEEGRRRPRCIWWIEGDLSKPDPAVWAGLADLVEGAEAIVVGRAADAPPGVEAEAIAPAIDPLAPRHLELSLRVAGGLARSAGLDLAKPFIVQTTEIDGWSWPELALDVLQAARDAGAEGLQLAIAARLPAGDPRAWRTLGELTDHAEGIDGVRLVADAAGAGDAEINAAQRLARVAVADGSELGVAEALWKGTPAVTADGADGLGEAYATPAERGRRVAELVADTGLAVELGKAGREQVRAKHLVTRRLVDELTLYARIVSGA